MIRNLLVILIAVLFFSCEKEQTTYTDLIEQEKINLDQFVKEKDFKILNVFPEDSVFAENEYVLLDNGVYLRIIDNGNAIPPAKGTAIQSVAKGCFLVGGKITKSFNGFELTSDETKWPLKFTYGDETFADNTYLGTGYSDVLKYVGNNSSVSMIVPFVVGSYLQNIEQTSIYFEEVTFVFN